VSTSAPRAMSPIWLGLAVTCRSTFHRPFEQGEAAFADRALGAEQAVVGAVVDGEVAAVGGSFDRNVDAVAGAFVAGVGQGGQVQLGGGPAGGGQDLVLFGAGEVVQVAGQDIGDPDRQAVGAHERLDVTAGSAVFPRVPRVDGFALDAGGGLRAAVGADQRPVQHDVGPAGLSDLPPTRSSST
jgi:hypothetical protein